MATDADDSVTREEIERRAYQRFCDRGSEHGADLDDWLAAEREVLAARDTIEADRVQRAQAGPKPRLRRAARS